LRTNREQIAASQLDYLAGVTETGSHYLSGIPKLLVVSVNFLDRLHPWIFRAFVIAIVRFLIPIVDPADERGDQLHLYYGCSHRLRQRKEQRHITANSLLLELFRRQKPFPGRRDLY